MLVSLSFVKDFFVQVSTNTLNICQKTIQRETKKSSEVLSEDFRRRRNQDKRYQRHSKRQEEIKPYRFVRVSESIVRRVLQKMRESHKYAKARKSQILQNHLVLTIQKTTNFRLFQGSWPSGLKVLKKFLENHRFIQIKDCLAIEVQEMNNFLQANKRTISYTQNQQQNTKSQNQSLLKQQDTLLQSYILSHNEAKGSLKLDQPLHRQLHP